jgi:hypothetical protein
MSRMVTQTDRIDRGDGLTPRVEGRETGSRDEGPPEDMLGPDQEVEACETGSSRLTRISA